MSAPRRIVLVASALLALAAPGVASANPAFRSVIERVQPPAPGLQLQVLGFDQNLQLVNRTGKVVVIRGYDDEPYARLLPDGTVQVNRNSPATYLNEDRFGTARVPSTAGAGKPTAWRTVTRNGRFVWHDHRMHWMNQSTPPSVTDTAQRTKVFDYAIPLDVGGRRATVHGTLWWVGLPGGGMPGAAIVALVVLTLAAVALGVVVRRRRRTAVLQFHPSA